jgi:hypothetical protein
VITSAACWADMAFEGRPGRPAGTSVSSTTFLFTLSRAIARRTARFRQARTPWRVRVLSDLARVASHSSTSVAVRSRSFRAPRYGSTCSSHRWRFASRVASPVIADSRRRDPTLTALIPMQAAVTARPATTHATPDSRLAT